MLLIAIEGQQTPKRPMDQVDAVLEKLNAEKGLEAGTRSESQYYGYTPVILIIY